MKLRPHFPGVRLALLLVVAASVSFTQLSAGAAQVAASIEFDAAPRPAGLPEDMQALRTRPRKAALRSVEGGSEVM